MLKKIIQLLSLPFWLIMSACARPAERPTQVPLTMTSSSFYDIKVNDLKGQPFDLHQLKGKKVLIVNTASECGYTPQYADLQKLHEQYGDKLIVLGFPCNDFGSQEPGTAEEIKTFCSTKYKVNFDMFSKISVKGEDIHPLYKFLTSADTDSKFPGDINWNFEKFLVDRNGQVINRFSPKTKPDADEVIKAIEAAIAAK